MIHEIQIDTGYNLSVFSYGAVAIISIIYCLTSLSCKTTNPSGWSVLCQMSGWISVLKLPTTISALYSHAAWYKHSQELSSMVSSLSTNIIYSPMATFKPELRANPNPPFFL